MMRYLLIFFVCSTMACQTSNKIGQKNSGPEIFDYQPIVLQGTILDYNRMTDPQLLNVSYSKVGDFQTKSRRVYIDESGRFDFEFKHNLVCDINLYIHGKSIQFLVFPGDDIHLDLTFHEEKRAVEEHYNNELAAHSFNSNLEHVNVSSQLFNYFQHLYRNEYDLLHEAKRSSSNKLKALKKEIEVVKMLSERGRTELKRIVENEKIDNPYILDWITEYINHHLISNLYFSALNPYINLKPPYSTEIQDTIDQMRIMCNQYVESLPDNTNRVLGRWYLENMEFHNYYAFKLKYGGRFNSSNFNKSENVLKDEIAFIKNTYDESIQPYLIASKLMRSMRFEYNNRAFNKILYSFIEESDNPQLKTLLENRKEELKRLPKKIEDIVQNNVIKINPDDRNILDILKNENKGKISIVNFWSTWSDASLNAIDYVFPDYVSKYNDKGVEFIFVARNSPEEKWKEKLTHFSFDAKHVFLNEYQSEYIQSNLGVSRAPYYIVMDQNGKIVSNNAPGPSRRLDQILEELL